MRTVGLVSQGSRLRRLFDGVDDLDHGRTVARRSWVNRCQDRAASPLSARLRLYLREFLRNLLNFP